MDGTNRWLRQSSFSKSPQHPNSPKCTKNFRKTRVRPDIYVGLKMAGRTSVTRTFHSRQAISEVLKAGGLRLRASGQGHGNPSQLKYGYRKEHGAVVPHLGEQQFVGAIKDLRNEGMTFRQIAQRMTALRIPSKNGKLRWHPMMIKRIIE